MQIQSLHETIVNEGCICSAVLRGDGQIAARVGANDFVLVNPPAVIVQIALAASSLWCLDRLGRVWQLQVVATKDTANTENAAKYSFRWTRDSELKRVIRIGRVTGGHVCVLTQRDGAFVKEQGIDAVSDTESGWVQSDEFTRWLQPYGRTNRMIPRFGLKSLICLITIAALMMGMIPMHLAAKRQMLAVRTIQGVGGEVRYSHEFNDDGIEIADAPMPGPQWLRNLLGDHWFVTPVKVKGERLDIDSVAQLSRLRSLDLEMHSPNKVLDFNRLSRLRELRDLRVDCYIEGTDGLAQLKNLESLTFHDCYIKTPKSERGDKRSIFESIGKLSKLKTLRMEIGRHLPVDERDIRPLGKLDQLRVLVLDMGYRTRHRFDISTFGGLTNLKHAKLGILSSMKSIENLRQLETLHIDGRGGRLETGVLAKLVNLKSLRIDRCPDLNTVGWLEGLTKLESLTIDGQLSDGKVVITDFAPMKKLTRLKHLKLNSESSTMFDVSLIGPTSLTLDRVIVGNGNSSRDRPRLDVRKRILNVAGCNVHHLESLPLASNLRAVYLNHNHLSDISALAKLRNLYGCFLDGNPITNISALDSKPELRIVSLAECPVDDIEVLSNASELIRIDLRGTKVTDLSPISKLKKLSNINLEGTAIDGFRLPENTTQRIEANLSGTRVRDLRRLPRHLYEVDLSDTEVDDLSGLSKWSRINELSLAGSKLKNLKSLPLVPSLRRLDLSRTQVSDLSGIEKLPGLVTLNLANSQVQDIGPLKNLRDLSKLELSCTQVKDIGALSNLKALNSLDISDTNVSDLSPLKKLDALGRLCIAGSKVDDLSPIADLFAEHGFDPGLVNLDVSRTSVVDLSHLKKYVFLREVNLSNTMVESLAGIPPRNTKFIALNCPRLTITAQDKVFSSVSSVEIDISSTKNLSVFRKLIPNLSYLTLQNLNHEHDFYWMKDMVYLRTPYHSRGCRRGRRAHRCAGASSKSRTTDFAEGEQSQSTDPRTVSSAADQNFTLAPVR